MKENPKKHTEFVLGSKIRGASNVKSDLIFKKEKKGVKFLEEETINKLKEEQKP